MLQNQALENRHPPHRQTYKNRFAILSPRIEPDINTASLEETGGSPIPWHNFMGFPLTSFAHKVKANIDYLNYKQYSLKSGLCLLLVIAVQMLMPVIQPANSYVLYRLHPNHSCNIMNMHNKRFLYRVNINYRIHLNPKIYYIPKESVTPNFVWT